MATTYTENLQLAIQDGSDYLNYALLAENFRKIDAAYGELLAQNIKTETSVGFYAEKLCISKQYLSLLVKEKTLVTISTVIASMRIEMAARLLRDRDLSIQQVAEQMSFSDQSSFGKFFKKHTGLSPLKYRQNLRKTLLTLRPKEILDETVRNLG